MISMLLRSCFCATLTKKYRASLIAVVGSLGVVERVYADTLFVLVCFSAPRLRAKRKRNGIFKCIFPATQIGGISRKVFVVRLWRVRAPPCLVQAGA